jgi:hypothetical protein
MERTRNETHIGTLGLVAIIGSVVLWDVYAEETISHAYGRYLDNPRTRLAAVGLLAITGAHLLRALPHHPIELDPFYWSIDRRG